MPFLSPHSTHQCFFYNNHTSRLKIIHNVLNHVERPTQHSRFQATSGSARSDLKWARASSVDASNHPLPDSQWSQPGQHNGDDVTPPTGELGVCAPVSSLSERASFAILSR